MSAPRKQLVIIDTDPGIDDVLASTLALASPELEILAFIVTFGNTDTEHAYNNMLKVHHVLSSQLHSNAAELGRFPGMVQASKPYLVHGEQGPLFGELHSATYFHGRDGLGGISERHPEILLPTAHEHPFYQSSELSGVDLAIDLINSYPARSITYIALGPLTTLARIMKKGGNDVKERIGRVLVMGGALDVPGNTSPVAEFNFFADPYAVAELFSPADPHTPPSLPLDRSYIFPLDLTCSHEFSFALYISTVDPDFESTQRPSKPEGKSPLVHFTSSFLERAREVMIQFGKDAVELHDIIPVWYLICYANEGGAPRGWKYVTRRFEVERMGEITRGMLVVDRRGAVDNEVNTSFAPGTNRAVVQAQLEQAVHKKAQPAQVEFEEEAVQKKGEEWDRPGVKCIIESPGSDKIVKLMLERVWNIVA